MGDRKKVVGVRLRTGPLLVLGSSVAAIVSSKNRGACGTL